jgi:uncharacterized protein
MKVSSGAGSAENYARVVVDTNVILSAALVPKSLPAEFLDRVLMIGQLVFSDSTFSELETRIWKPKFDRYISLERRKQLLGDLSASAHWVEVGADIAAITHSRDADDDKFVHLALACGLTRLVTGDEDLLVLRAVEKVKIVSPRDALLECTDNA